MSLGFNLQSLAVAPLVLLALAYSAWVLMPGSLRRALALGMARQRWLGRIPAIARAARAPAGCGCDGCDRSAIATDTGKTGDTLGGAINAPQVVRVVRRRPTA